MNFDRPGPVPLAWEAASLIAFVVVIAVVLVVFGAGVAVVPILLVVAAIPALLAVNRRLRDNRRVGKFRQRSGLDDDIDDGPRPDDEPIHGPTG